MDSVHTPQSYCRASAARGDITPPVGIYHRMWGAATHDRSTGVHRPLTATVLAIRPADSQPAGAGVVLIALDHCILADADLREIRRRVAEVTSFDAGDVHVSLTHTHGAGLMMHDRADLPGGEMIGPYLESLAQRVGQLAREAERNLQPAWIAYATGRCDLACHRDFWDEQNGRFVCGFNPNESADDTLLVARLTGESGQRIATLVNYACHPTTLAWANTLISPDYLGAMRETIEAATAGAPSLFLQGASGELGPREGFVGDVAVADRNGRRLAYAALGALESLPPPATRFAYAGPVVSGAVLGTWAHVPLDEQGVGRASRWNCRSWTIELAYRDNLPKLDATRARREQSIADEGAANARGDIVAARDLHAQVEQMTRQIMRLEALPPGPTYPLPVAAWQVGDAVYVCVAGEHYSVLQTALRSRLPNLAVFVATITDGWQPGYVPTAQTFGKGIYQESIAMVAPESLDRVIEEIGAQISRWNDDK